MTTKRKFKPGDLVRVHNCRGVARIDRQIHGYGVYLLDRQMSVRYRGTGYQSDFFISYWTFEPKDLQLVRAG